MTEKRLYKIWEKAEKDFLINKYSEFTNKQLADYLNRTIESVKNQLRKINIKRIRREDRICSFCGKKISKMNFEIKKNKTGLFYCDYHCLGKGKEMDKNNQWNGGKIIDFKGYVKIKKRNHPNADSRGYVFEHRLMMEKKIGRFLYDEELVHHKNCVKGDNHIGNLMLVDDKIHRRIHKKLRRGKGYGR